MKVPRPVAPQEVWAALASMAPYGWLVAPIPNGFRVQVDQAVVRVHLKPRPAATRLRLTLEYPWWAWLGLLAGVVGGIVTTAVYYGMSSGLLKDVRACLSHAFLAGAPAPAAVAPPAAATVACPFCNAQVVPAQDAAGLKTCPVCHNTGRPLVPAAWTA